MHMVPWYQLAVHAVVAALLLFAAIYSPVVINKRLPRWLELGFGGLAVVLLGSATFALLMGNWPFR